MSEYALSIVEGGSLTLTLSGPAGPAGPAGDVGVINTSTSTNLTGFISGNGTNVNGATAATAAATPNTLVMRNANGGASFSGGNGVGVTITSVNAKGADIMSSTGTGAFILSVSGIGALIKGGGTGAEIYSDSGIGADIYSDTGTGAYITSFSGTGAEISSEFGVGATIISISGVYHATFGDSGINQSFVARDKGAFGWFRNDSRTLRIQAADSIAASRTYTIPDSAIATTLPVVPAYANLTAANTALDVGDIWWDTTLLKLRTAPAVTTGRTIYVDTNGTDTRGSLSKYNLSVPFATIGAAMAASVIGDTVRVRAGNYTITQTINLNGEGNLHLEEGAVVTCSVSGPVFVITANESKSISGGGQFIITGSTTTFWLQSGGGLQTQLCSVECATISTTTSPLNAATIFNVSSGVLVVNAETVYALASTIISCAGTSSNLHYAVKFTYCSRFAHFPTSGSSAQLSCNCWTIACFGPKCFQIVGGTVGAKYETLIDNAPTGCTFFSLEYGNNSTANALIIKGGRAITYSTKPCIRFTTTTGTNKFVRLIGDPFFHTAGVNSITAASARSVLCSFASSNKGVNTSFVTIVGGTYAVNAGFIS
jgi:hypothetical protein